MIDFDDLDTNPTASTPKKVDTAAIRAGAHIANGGDAMHTCAKCSGTGMTRWGQCYQCQGKGQRSTRSLAASKAKVTAAINRENREQAFRRDHADVIEFLGRNSDWSDFYRELNAKLAEYGFLTENQLAAVQRGMAKMAARKAEKAAARAAAAPVVDMTAIEKLFATAIDNDIKRPIFRADGIEISRAPATGRNAGALYVKAGGEYAGKITAGKFHSAYGAPQDTFQRLQAVAVDPLAESVKYARRTGNCGMCGRQLVDPVSIRAGIGPICADNWGLDWKRDAARDELDGEA